MTFHSGTGYNWKVRTNFGHEYHVAKQEKMFISTCPETFNVRVVSERVLYMRDGASAHFSRAVRDVHSDAYRDWRMVEEDSLHGLHASKIWILWIFTYGDTYQPLCTQFLLTRKRHFTIALWMPVRLPATTPASLHGCGCPWWEVPRRALNLMEDILSTYYKCTHSAITHKLNVSGHVLICTFCCCFGVWNSCSKFVCAF
jgi:hypothetical protein